MDAPAIIAVLAVGASLGGAIVSAIMKHISDERADAQRELIKVQGNFVREAMVCLNNLRRNAFLTNEHGHRVRYHKASAEVRARAEAE